MRTSVRRTTASSQTTIGTTRTTCSSPRTTPMTALTHCTCTSTDAWRTCTETVRASLFHRFRDETRTPHGSSSERIHSRRRSYSWAHLFDSPSPLFFYLFFLSVTVFLFHHELFLEPLNTKCMANNLRCSAAEESEDTQNAFASPTSPAGL